MSSELPPNVRRYEFCLPSDKDMVVLLAPKGKLRRLHETVRYLYDDFAAEATLADYLDWATFESDEYGDMGYFMDARSWIPPRIINFTEKLIFILNGGLGPESKKFALSLRSAAARRDSWPVLVRATSSGLPENFRDFALRSIGVGSQIGIRKRSGQPYNPISKISIAIVQGILSLLSDPELSIKWPYGYLRPDIPPLAITEWPFWRSAIEDDLALRFGSPDQAAAVEERRLAFRRAQSDYYEIPFPPRMTLEEARAKLRRRLNGDSDQGQSTVDSRPRRTKKWSFSEHHKNIAGYLQKKKANGVKGDRGLYNLLKREVRDDVKRMIKYIEQETKSVSPGPK